MCRQGEDEQVVSFHGLTIIDEEELRHDIIRPYEDHNYEHYFSRFFYGDYCSKYHPPTSSHRKIETAMGGVKLTFIVKVYSAGFHCGQEGRRFNAEVELSAKIVDPSQPRFIDLTYYKGIRDSSGNLVSRHQFETRRHKENVYDLFHTVITNESELGCYVRVLKPRSTPIDKFTDPTAKHSVICQVNGVKFYVDKWRLMEVSSYFAAMFNEKFKFQESLQRVVELEGIGDATDFNDFLHAIAERDAVPPDPTNVGELSHMADYFDVEQLKKSCANHLRLCPDLPMSVRLEIAMRSLPNDAVLELLKDVTATEKNKLVLQRR